MQKVGCEGVQRAGCGVGCGGDVEGVQGCIWYKGMWRVVDGAEGFGGGGGCGFMGC